MLKLVHFGWKKEAIPITLTKKSFIARFFELYSVSFFVIFRNISCFKVILKIVYKIFNAKHLSKNIIQ